MQARRTVALLAAVAACCVAGAGAAGGKKWAGSGEMFDAIAPRYDFINSFLSLGMHSWWRRRMVAALNLQPGAPCLALQTTPPRVCEMPGCPLHWRPLHWRSALARLVSVARTSSTASRRARP
jgi:hypothetical protein